MDYQKIIEEFLDYNNNYNPPFVDTKFNNVNEIDIAIKDIIEKVEKEAKNIALSWSIPLITEAISFIYVGCDEQIMQYGTTFKRALVYLYKAKKDAKFINNKDKLLKVLELSYILENLYAFKRLFLINELKSNGFYFEYNHGVFEYPKEFEEVLEEFSFLIQGRGERQRTSKINNSLFLVKFEKFQCALKEVLKGSKPSQIELFNGTFFHYLPDISSLGDFWYELFLRHKLFISLILNSKIQNSLLNNSSLSPEEAKNIMVSLIRLNNKDIKMIKEEISPKIVDKIIWNKQDWISNKKDEIYSDLIIERPILNVVNKKNAVYLTSASLLADSINYFIEGVIFRYSYDSINFDGERRENFFRKVFTKPFENKVVEELRNRGFEAGCVEEAGGNSGRWKTQTGEIKIDGNCKMPGEIDVLSYNSTLNIAMILECKVIKDIKDYKSYINILKKVNKFKDNVLKKQKWVIEALSNHFNFSGPIETVILSDIPLPIINPNSNDVYFYGYNDFFYDLDEIIAEIMSE